MANRKAYFGISKSNRIFFDKEIESIRHCLEMFQVSLEVFVDKYDFLPEQEREMMKTAFEAIDNSDFVIVEVSKKAIGVGIEVGYAKAKNKPIIYLKKSSSKYSTTVGGSSDYIIEYEDEMDLYKQLNEVLDTYLKSM